MRILCSGIRYNCRFYKSLVIKLIHIEKMVHQYGYFLWCFVDWLCNPLS